MMDEHKFAWEIVSDLNAIWGEDCQRKTWAVLGEGNPYEGQRKAIVRERLERYQATLAGCAPASLHLTANLRASELGQLYQQAAEFWPSLETSDLSDFHRNMIRTLRDLTIGYAAASVIAYYQQGINLNLPANIRAEEDALAASAVLQGLTDADTFQSILHASTQGGRSQGRPQPKPKDVVLNNPTAVALLEKMKEAGLLDANYQWITTYENGRPIRITHYRKAAYADYISRKVGLGKKWTSVFANLWQEETARQLTRGLSEAAHCDFSQEFTNVFG